MNRLKLLFLCDRRDWAFDLTARSLAKYLRDIDVEFAYVWEKPDLSEFKFDLIYVFWWGETWHNQFDIPKCRILKEISSHRWRVERGFGFLSPLQAHLKYMIDAGTIVVTSAELYDYFRDLGLRVGQYRLGTPEFVTNRKMERSGLLTFGWCGNPSDLTKGLKDIIVPASEGIANVVASPGDLSWNEMDEFYEGLDVLLISSIAEGTPLPLLEAMRKGCFIVSTSVGVVPELIKAGRNGLIVDRNIHSFREALLWSVRNSTVVRQASAINSSLVASRNWRTEAEKFQGIIKNHVAFFDIEIA